MIKCIYEDGKEVPLRHVTVDSIVVREGKLLLIQRGTNYHIEPGKLALPGGFLDRDEAAAQGAMREVLEETGYTPLSATLYMIIDTPRLKGDDRQNVAFVFLTKVGEKVQEPDFEVMGVNWYDLVALPPRKEFGFDHFDMVQHYLNHTRVPKTLPYFNFGEV